MTVDDLYDILTECGMHALADILWSIQIMSRQLCWCDKIVKKRWFLWRVFRSDQTETVKLAKSLKNIKVVWLLDLYT